MLDWRHRKTWASSNNKCRTKKRSHRAPALRAQALKNRAATAVAIDRVRAEADASVMRRVSKAAADYQVSSARAVRAAIKQTASEWDAKLKRTSIGQSRRR